MLAEVLTVLIIIAIVLVDTYFRDRQRRWIQREIARTEESIEMLERHIERFERHLAHNDGVMDRLREQVQYKSSTKKGSN